MCTQVDNIWLVTGTPFSTFAQSQSIGMDLQTQVLGHHKAGLKLYSSLKNETTYNRQTGQEHVQRKISLSQAADKLQRILIRHTKSQRSAKMGAETTPTRHQRLIN